MVEAESGSPHTSHRGCWCSAESHMKRIEGDFGPCDSHHQEPSHPLLASTNARINNVKKFKANRFLTHLQIIKSCVSQPFLQLLLCLFLVNCFNSTSFCRTEESVHTVQTVEPPDVSGLAGRGPEVQKLLVR